MTKTLTERKFFWSRRLAKNDDIFDRKVIHIEILLVDVEKIGIKMGLIPWAWEITCLGLRWLLCLRVLGGDGCEY